MKELSLHILDIAQNSVRAKAKKIIITVKEIPKDDIFEFSIDDDGNGINNEILDTIKNPFTTTRNTRKVGLGIPLLDNTCKQCNGQLIIKNKKTKGTYLFCYMEYNHIDRPPLGDISSTIVGLIASNRAIYFKYIHIYNNNKFILDTNEIYSILEDTPITNPKIYNWLRVYIEQNIKDIKK